MPPFVRQTYAQHPGPRYKNIALGEQSNLLAAYLDLKAITYQ